MSGAHSDINNETISKNWSVIKYLTAFIGLLLLLEFAYFLYTAHSSVEITLICIFIFSVITNIPIFYSMYKQLG
jgi:hypothetical protein